MSAEVPFLDLRPARRQIAAELEAAHARVLASGRFLLGPELERFEAEFAAYCGASHCVGVGSGFSAIELALRAAGVGPGDEVIVPAYAPAATWLAVTSAAAVPVGVDVDPDTYNIDPALIAAALTERSAAIVPVHLRGEPAAMDEIASIAAARGLVVVEDAAQAHGALHRGRRVGTIGDAGAFSFYPSKNLGGIGDGGAVVTDDAALAERVRRLRNYGMRGREEIVEAGVNSRLAEPQAAALRVMLPRLEAWNGVRAELAARYGEALAAREEIALPATPAWARPVWHLYVVGLADRDAVAEALAARGVGTLVHYRALPHLAAPYRERWPPGSFPVAERLARRCLSLPLNPQLGAAACDRVAATLLETVGPAASA